jgi:hypothetical protein
MVEVFGQAEANDRRQIRVPVSGHGDFAVLLQYLFDRASRAGPRNFNVCRYF